MASDDVIRSKDSDSANKLSSISSLLFMILNDDTLLQQEHKKTSQIIKEVTGKCKLALTYNQNISP